MRRFFLVSSLALALGALWPAAQALGATALGDFNSDGRSDLAVGASGEDVGTTPIPNAGAVNVIYGSAPGLAGPGNQFWHQNQPGILDTAENDDGFGEALAAGDFNGDTFADLAIGASGEDVGSVNAAGAVNVLYGSSSGLISSFNQFWNQDSPDVLDTAEGSDRFGDTLTTGDFNGDGRDDLAVGVTGEGVAGNPRAGAANVIYGSPTGLTATGATPNQFWHQDSTNILDTVEQDDNFGWALAAGDFNGNGRDDLAVGVPRERVSNFFDGGAANVIYGTASGLAAAGNQFWNQGSPNVEDNVEGEDLFGSALAAGDFNGNGRDDLAVGVPSEEIHTTGLEHGAVNVLYGTATNLSATGDQFWSQDSPNIRDAAEGTDNFGFTLAAGNFNGDARDDLAVAATNETLGSIQDAGAVNVIYGNTAGLAFNGNQFWNQDSPGIRDTVEQGDIFGTALTAGDFNGDTRDDLAVGVPFEDIGTVLGAGAANVIYGSAGSGLIRNGNQFWHQDSPGIRDVVENEDFFGLALTSGAPGPP